MESSGYGPYETGRQAYQDAQGTYEAMRHATTPGTMRQVNEQVLTAACQEAGVQLWAYDQRVLHWLAGFEPEAVQVIAGWVRRANASSP